jgi:hypothetical protein
VHHDLGAKPGKLQGDRPANARSRAVTSAVEPFSVVAMGPAPRESC